MTRPRLSIAQLMAIVLSIGFGLGALINIARKNREIAELSARIKQMKADESRKRITLLTVIAELRDRLERPEDTLSLRLPAGSTLGPMRFALVGRMDLNRDGKDDRNEIKRMIQDAGGVIDFDLPPPDVGTETGQIMPRIDWYVIDEGTLLHGSDSSKSDQGLVREAQFQQRVGQVVKEARSNGIRPLRVGQWRTDPKASKSAVPGGRSAGGNGADPLPSPRPQRAE